MLYSRLFLGIILPGQNSIIIVAGANLDLTEQDIYDAEAAIAKASVVVCQLEIRQEITLLALKLAKKHGGYFVGVKVPTCPNRESLQRWLDVAFTSLFYTVVDPHAQCLGPD